MMRSLFAGVSALRNHQIRMDVIGNNIANVNTIGFKASRVTFQEMLSQKIRDASSPQGDRGGTNPMQVGLGSTLATINVNHTQGNLETTGVGTDLAIEGAGYFVLGDGLQRYYSRAGMLAIDRQGNLLLDGTGLKVLGWTADINGNIDANTAPSALSIPISATIDPRAATSIVYAGNLDSRTTGSITLEPFTIENGTDTAQATFKFTPTGNFNEFRWEMALSTGTATVMSGTVRVDSNGDLIWEDNSGTSVTNTVVTLDAVNPTVTINFPSAVGVDGSLGFSWAGGTESGTADGVYTVAPERATTLAVYDSLGNTHDIVMRFIKTGNNSWDWEAEDIFGNSLGTGALSFDSSGRLVGSTGSINFTPPGGAATPMTIQPDFSGLFQVAEESTAQAIEQDGYPAGELATFSIDSRGVINGSFSNGLNRQLGQIALANFVNPAGLAKAGDNLYVVTNNSGDPLIGTAGTGDLGEISSGALEMSNVDLSQEFTNMIITQRGFQANSRIITTSDEMLQELVNLKR